MKTVTLQILASDILTTQFTNSEDCAITRALSRAGYPHMRHTGFEIASGKPGIDEVYYATNDKNPELVDLSDKVDMMYMNLEKPEDFEHTLELDID